MAFSKFEALLEHAERGDIFSDEFSVKEFGYLVNCYSNVRIVILKYSDLISVAIPGFAKNGWKEGKLKVCQGFEVAMLVPMVETLCLVGRVF